ncbi:hypothetical protein, partial [Shewanella dokdonensis]|uniref:hypothetical protein n=1 Tax=Shewanella dokdonensis TaxID=712036 RepID=UPI00200F79CB
AGRCILHHPNLASSGLRQSFSPRQISVSALPACTASASLLPCQWVRIIGSLIFCASTNLQENSDFYLFAHYFAQGVIFCPYNGENSSKLEMERSDNDKFKTLPRHYS